MAMATVMAVAAPATARAAEMDAIHARRPAKRTSQPARRGRPLKFGRPARAVTLTLPVDVLEALQAIDGDISRAVVRAVEPLVASPTQAAGLATYGENAVIVVPPNRMLRDRLGIELVPLAGGRALLSFDESMPISEIELRIGDALADPAFGKEDRVVFEAVAEILRTARRDGKTALARRSIIVLQRPGATQSIPTVPVPVPVPVRTADRVGESA
jgi:hypothetical protein